MDETKDCGGSELAWTQCSPHSRDEYLLAMHIAIARNNLEIIKGVGGCIWMVKCKGRIQCCWFFCETTTQTWGPEKKKKKHQTCVGFKVLKKAD